jgi:mono/diheme cytochrome c family protein
VAAAEAYVKSQTGLTNISMFDNFVARMASSSSYQTAAQVARVYVASMQKTLDSSDACVSSTMAAVVKSSSDATEKNSASSHDRETHISDDLTSHLSEVRHAADQVAKSCSATNLSKECKDLIKNLAPIMTCTTPTKPTTPITPPNPTPTTPTTPTPPATGSAQSISFTGPGNQTMGVAPPVLNATASSGLAVSYATQTPAVCTVAGSTLTLVAAGTCTVTASQAGNSSWAAATPLSQSFTVLAAATTPGASALNGKALYTANSIMACAPCHGMPPSVNKVLNGANNPNLIQNAINGGTGGMGMYNGKFSSQQIADIAAYLATPGI